MKNEEGGRRKGEESIILFLFTEPEVNTFPNVKAKMHKNVENCVFRVFASQKGFSQQPLK